MSDDTTFRVHVRLNTIEHSDLQDDLDRFPQGAARAGRIRQLLRLGLAAATGEISAHKPRLAQVHERPNSSASSEVSAEANPSAVVHADLQAIETFGLDISAFKLGGD